MTKAARQIAAALLLGLATFAAVTATIANIGPHSFPVGFWVANGIPLAVLLRTSRKRWPLLIAGAVVGDFVAGLLFRQPGFVLNMAACISNVAQYGFIALVLRARFGAYFNLLHARQVRWLLMLSVPATLLKGLIQTIAAAASGHRAATLEIPLIWFLSCLLGLFVLSLPLLAIASPQQQQRMRFDTLGAAIVGFIVVLGFIIYGPPAFTALYLIMPPLMLLAWRYGLFAAGLGALVNNVLGSVLAITTSGITVRLMAAGYDNTSIGVYLGLFYNAAILISLPVAVARVQQKNTESELAAALSAAERRAAQLADSEAAIRRSQTILEQSEQRFRTIFERAPLGIALVDPETNRFLDVNPNFVEIAGWKREDILKETWRDITDPRTLVEEADKAQALISGEVPTFQIEKSYPRTDGSTVWVNLAVTYITIPGSDSGRLLVMIEDISERKAFQQQLHAVQRLEAVGQLTGGIAHDFNNLLTVVIGSSEALADELDDPEQRELARLILDTAERAGELTRGLLAFARRQPLSPTAFEVNRLLDNCEPLIRRTLGPNLDFKIESAPDAGTIFADRSQTEAAVINLCLNARDAMPDGGRLTVTTGRTVLDEEFVRTHSGARIGDFVVICVSDTGTGIAPEVLDRIFEPFFTTKESGRGTGLGLSMVYGFVQQSHGYIDVETREGEGTTFSLYLPVAHTRAAAEDPTAPDAIRGGAETILVVEDDGIVRRHVCNQLRGLGYDVMEAEEGAGALAILEGRPDVSLLFTDVMMPGGMNGLELAERARVLQPQLRILFSSGYSDEVLNQTGHEIDHTTLLPKPYSRRDLAEKIREAIDKTV
ncbi:ATP-binding protein [Novosphingobium sp. JCM 18896]|uniref:ATP-binding protein n=1 Tax=Novosphingobium sp. JCM 18896 TaxID=2989731 RepID=UPI002222C6DF|nr:ATP-binding protein [Novosphingobium sp. JCM 18896]MCW1428462.1 PAS domain S-box protein [Novosphingobium sp. JCM 18896]